MPIIFPSGLNPSVAVSSLSAMVSTPLAVSVPAKSRPDLNAFVNHKVSNTSTLISQVKRDPEVADRYERHFSMNRKELISYLQTLHAGKLGREGVYTVYSVPDGGRVKMHMEKLKKGSPMFFDAAGKPTLIVKCGNPVVLGPSRARRGNPLVVAPTGRDTTRTMALLTPGDAETVEPTETVALVPEVPEPILGNVAPSEPSVVPTGTALATTTANIASVPAIAAGGHAFPYAALLPLGFLGLIHHNGDNGDIQAVPEPATMVIMGLGLVGVATRRRRR